MQRQPFTIICLLALGSFLLSACGNQPTETYVPIIYEGQDYVDNHETPPFFYQYEERNTETHSTRGWLIDRQGYLRKYENVSVKLFHDNNLASMKAFLNQTEVVMPIDLNLLVDHYKKNLILSRIKPTHYESYNRNSKVSTYYAYTLSYPDVWGTNASQARKPGFYNRFILESKGEEMVILEHTAARAMLSYLQEVARDAF